MGTVLAESLRAWWPEAILSLGALLVVLVGVWRRQGRAVVILTWAVLIACGVALWHAPVPTDTAPFFGLIICDPFSLVFRWIALGTIAIVLLLVLASRELEIASRGECLGLLLFIGVGLMLMAEANHLLMA